MPMYAIGERPNKRGKHFRKAFDLPASPHAARLKLRAGLADYSAFVRRLYLKVPGPIRSAFWFLFSWALGNALTAACDAVEAML